MSTTKEKAEPRHKGTEKADLKAAQIEFSEVATPCH